SYCDTVVELFVFCGWVPAYTVPALPSGLNAEPGAAAAASDGVFVASPSPQVWLGWPVPVRLGFPANAVAGTATARLIAAATTRTMRFTAPPFLVGACRERPTSLVLRGEALSGFSRTGVRELDRPSSSLSTGS